MLYLYLSYNLDGLLVAPHENGVPDSKRRIFVSGQPDIKSLNKDQINALIELAFRDSKVRANATSATFYDGDHWAKSDRIRAMHVHMW